MGEFCVTLALTGACFGWAEVHAPRNRARRWVKERAALTAAAPTTEGSENAVSVVS